MTRFSGWRRGAGPVTVTLESASDLLAGIPPPILALCTGRRAADRKMR